MSTTTPPHIIERKRQNAQFSTGLATPEGKAVVRFNALKHGLTANPAAGIIEDAEAFEHLHFQLVNQIVPQNPIEAGLVHRIAVSLWRLQRAARIDSAMSDLDVTKVQNRSDEVQPWIERLNGHYWETRLRPEEDLEVLRRLRERGRIKRGEPFYRITRPWLKILDKVRDEHINQSGAALTAMGVMLTDLVDRMEHSPKRFIPRETQMLAWLLGDTTERLLVMEERSDRGNDGFFYPDEQDFASENDQIIGRERNRDEGTPLSAQFRALVEGHMMSLRQLRISCEDPYTAANRDPDPCIRYN